MIFRHQNSRKTISVFAALTAAIAVVATSAIYAPASFGSSRLRAAFWDTEPIIFAVPTTVTPGSQMPCGVEFAEAPPEPKSPAALKSSPAQAAVTDTKNVTIYSDPPGVISYSGTVTGSSATVSATVSATAAPGPVTVYIETDGSAPISASTTVVSN